MKPPKAVTGHSDTERSAVQAAPALLGQEPSSEALMSDGSGPGCVYEQSLRPIMWSVCPQELWRLSRERQLKEEMRRERDKEIELAIWTLEEETSKDKEECERAADNRWDGGGEAFIGFL